MDVTAADPTLDMGVNTLLPLAHRPTELGRIRLGYKAVKGNTTYPAKLEKFRLTSANAPLLEAAAALYGGKVRPWADAPDEGYHELYTESRALDVLIPTDIRTVSQAYELWNGGTCERRCDGTTEALSDGPCICGDERGADGTCEIMTRVSIMLPRLPGLGVWRLDSGGYQAATSMPATIELLRRVARSPWIPAVLRAEPRSKRVREPDGKVVTHRFVVPVIDLPGLTIGDMVSGLPGVAEVPRIEAVAPAAPTARERVAERRQAVEATTSGAPAATGRARSGQGPAAAARAERGVSVSGTPARDDAARAAEPARADEPPHPAEAAEARAVRPASAAPDEGASTRDPARSQSSPSGARASSASSQSGEADAHPVTVLCGRMPPPKLGAKEPCAKDAGHLDSGGPGAKVHQSPDATWTEEAAA